ncbi:MAG: response regulator [Treponema sp.]|jgi:DNA-binding response OmpR family regulator|nr:response regulator [Treponema sp.]
MSKEKKKRKKILLVDDDEIHLITAELCLKDEYDIYKAKSGDEALKCLRNKDFVPDLIMLDIVMPKMDGWEVFKKIKGITAFKDTPILFLTSMDGEEEKERARTLGAVDYITKPLEMTLLKNTISEIFRIREI